MSSSSMPATPENLAAAAKLVRATVSAEARRISYAHQMERFRQHPGKWMPTKGYANWISVTADKKNCRLVLRLRYDAPRTDLTYYEPMVQQVKEQLRQEMGLEVEVFIDDSEAHYTITCTPSCADAEEAGE